MVEPKTLSELLGHMHERMGDGPDHLGWCGTELDGRMWNPPGGPTDCPGCIEAKAQQVEEAMRRITVDDWMDYIRDHPADAPNCRCVFVPIEPKR